jgi:hypothetical protein
MARKTKGDHMRESIERLGRLNRNYKDDPEMAHDVAALVLLDYLEATGSKALADAYRALREKVGLLHA